MDGQPQSNMPPQLLRNWRHNNVANLVKFAEAKGSTGHSLYNATHYNTVLDTTLSCHGMVPFL